MNEYKIRKANGDIVAIKGELFTGQYDKEGTPIFEGDVVEWEGSDRPFSSKMKFKKRRSKVTYDFGVKEKLKSTEVVNYHDSGFICKPADDEKNHKFCYNNWCVTHKCKVVKG